MKLTPWFPGDTKPVHIGIYQRNYGIDSLSRYWYCKWDGQNWAMGHPNFENAKLEINESICQHLPWRGILK